MRIKNRADGIANRLVYAGINIVDIYVPDDSWLLEALIKKPAKNEWSAYKIGIRLHNCLLNYCCLFV